MLTNDTSGTVPNFIVLALGQLNEQLGDLVFNLHFAQDGRTIVGHRDFSVRRHKDLIQAFRSERSADDVRNGAGRKDMRLQMTGRGKGRPGVKRVSRQNNASGSP